MSRKQIFLSLIAAAVILEVIGDVMLKKWALNGRQALLALGFGLYIVGSVFWVVSLKYEYLSKAISIFVIFNLVLLILAGVVLFKENLSPVNKIGILLGIFSVMLIEW